LDPQEPHEYPLWHHLWSCSGFWILFSGSVQVENGFGDEGDGGREIDGKPLQLNQITFPEWVSGCVDHFPERHFMGI